MFIDLLLGMCCVLGFLPLVTGYCAYSYGRSFWLWFVLGGALPLVSLVGLAVLLRCKEMRPGEQLLAQARAILEADEAADAARWQQVQEALRRGSSLPSRTQPLKISQLRDEAPLPKP
jgi:hypothetical protein